MNWYNRTRFELNDTTEVKTKNEYACRRQKPPNRGSVMQLKSLNVGPIVWMVKILIRLGCGQTQTLSTTLNETAVG